MTLLPSVHSMPKACCQLLIPAFKYEALSVRIRLPTSMPHTLLVVLPECPVLWCISPALCVCPHTTDWPVFLAKLRAVCPAVWLMLPSSPCISSQPGARA